MNQGPATVIHARAIRDAAGVEARPGSVAVDAGKVVYAGCPEGLPEGFAGQTEVLAYPDHLLLPAMVNAHTHLELTDLGPRPYDPSGGFVGWVEMLLQKRGYESYDLIESVRGGINASLAAGIQAVGDIGSNSEIATLRKQSILGGVTFLELFGLGPPFDTTALNEITQASDGLQPHAPYSAGPAVYAAAARSGQPVSTHLAETRDECAFVASATGPKMDFIKKIERWDDAFANHYDKGLSPVAWMQPHLEAAAPDGGWLVAHCNYVSDEDIAILADTNTSVAYCPIASEYFGHTDHRYRDMLAAGVNVCLGTDSIVCADPNDAQPLGLLSAMRRLYQRDQTDPLILLRIATVNGAKALRLAPNTATLSPGAPAKFALATFDPNNPLDALMQVLSREEPVSPMYL